MRCAGWLGYASSEHVTTSRAKTNCVHTAQWATNAPPPNGMEHNPMSDFDISLLCLILMQWTGVVQKSRVVVMERWNGQIFRYTAQFTPKQHFNYLWTRNVFRSIVLREIVSEKSLMNHVSKLHSLELLFRYQNLIHLDSENQYIVEYLDTWKLFAVFGSFEVFSLIFSPTNWPGAEVKVEKHKKKHFNCFALLLKIIPR